MAQYPCSKLPSPDHLGSGECVVDVVRVSEVITGGDMPGVDSQGVDSAGIVSVVRTVTIGTKLSEGMMLGLSVVSVLLVVLVVVLDVEVGSSLDDTGVEVGSSLEGGGGGGGGGLNVLGGSDVTLWRVDDGGGGGGGVERLDDGVIVGVIIELEVRDMLGVVEILRELLKLDDTLDVQWLEDQRDRVTASS